MKEKTAVPRLPLLQALGLPWSALKLIAAQPGAMTINVLIMTGLMLLFARPSWLVLGAPLFLVFAIGGLSWMQRPQGTKATGFPWGRLLRLSVGFYLLTVPFALVVAAATVAGDSGKGVFLLLFAVSVGAHYTSTEFLLWWSPFMANAMILAAVLPVCLAPAWVAVHGQGARQAVWFSVRCWLRNPVATVLVAIVALIVAGVWALIEVFYWRYGAPGRSMRYLAMAAANLILIAVLTAFGRSMSSRAPDASTTLAPPDPSQTC